MSKWNNQNKIRKIHKKISLKNGIKHLKEEYGIKYNKILFQIKIDLLQKIYILFDK
jgi:hypothetical protein